jgi:hypothetical protein
MLKDEFKKKKTNKEEGEKTSNQPSKPIMQVMRFG